LGRPALDFVDLKIIAILDRELFHSAYSLAEAIGVSHSTIFRHLQDSLDMKNFHLRWIPHLLTEDLRQGRVSIYKKILPRLEAQEKKTFHDLAIDDECWFMLQYKHEAQLAVSRQKVSSKVRPNSQVPKFMFALFGELRVFT
jgi:hypothetical protein